MRNAPSVYNAAERPRDAPSRHVQPERGGRAVQRAVLHGQRAGGARAEQRFARRAAHYAPDLVARVLGLDRHAAQSVALHQRRELVCRVVQPVVLRALPARVARAEKEHRAGVGLRYIHRTLCR